MYNKSKQNMMVTFGFKMVDFQTCFKLGSKRNDKNKVTSLTQSFV